MMANRSEVADALVLIVGIVVVRSSLSISLSHEHSAYIFGCYIYCCNDCYAATIKVNETCNNSPDHI